MSLAPGVRLGAYEIVALIGAGGMGEVYRARDTRLGRDVAIKVLPDAFAGDADRVARFQREAQVLAVLNHTNIAHIHGVEEAGTTKALVLEFVDGPTLADRIALAPIGVAEAVSIAQQIADALQAAHEHGIIHRDLKPANIKLTSDGTVKVLDFGLAKASDAADPGSVRLQADRSALPTITSPAMTGMGVVLGTAAYMSPEQARGRPADKRSDVWAFGCVLFEMLTGKRPFEGEDAAETLAFVMAREPEWSALPQQLNPALARLLRGCLERDRRRRIADIAAAVFALDAAVMRQAQVPGAEHTTRRPVWTWRRVTSTAAAAIGVLVIGGVAGWTWRAPNEPAIVRTAISLPSSLSLTTSASGGRDVVITPDGTHVVFIGNQGTQLCVRQVGQLEPRPLVTGRGLTAPFVSPNGQWIGYFERGSLKKVPMTGGSPITLVSNGAFGGAAWGPDDTIVFTSGEPTGGLHRISAVGSDASVLTKPSYPRETYHVVPEFLPGGEWVLFTILTSGRIDAAEIAAYNLRTGESRVLIRGGSHAHYVPTGHLVFGVSGTLRAVPFDPDRVELRGAPTPVMAGVVMKAFGAANFAVAQNGSLVYVAGSVRTGVAPTRGEVMTVARDGAAMPLLPVADYREPRLSPDGKRLAVSDGLNIWVYDLMSRRRIKLTSDDGATRAVWMPDGLRVAFRSGNQGEDLFSTAADGSGRPQPLLVRPGGQFAAAVSPDGSVFAFDEYDQFGGRDIGVVPENGTAVMFAATRFSERSPRFSADGRWIAYVSNESGRDEVYLQPYPGPGPKITVSVSGGTEPVWSPKGNELFYRHGQRFMSVPVRMTPSPIIGTPQVLFEGPYAPDNVASPNTPSYDVFPDGRRFVMIRPGNQENAEPQISMILVQNWFKELRQLVPNP